MISNMLPYTLLMFLFISFLKLIMRLSLLSKKPFFSLIM